MIEKIAKEISDEERKLEDAEKKRQEEMNKEKKKKIEEKRRKKENEKKVRIEKAKILGQRWAMAKWITQFIKENQERWDLEKMEKEKIERKYLEEWEKARRFEKIRILKKKWGKKNVDLNKESKEKETKSLGDEGKWKVWRTKSTIQPEIEASTAPEAPLQTTIQAKPSYPIPMSNNSEGAPPVQVGPLTSLYEGSLGGSQGWGVAPPGGSKMTPKPPTRVHPKKTKTLNNLNWEMEYHHHHHLYQEEGHLKPVQTNQRKKIQK